MRKLALITGITGQDGAYLAELLLAKDYEVHGIKRRSSLLNTARIDHLYQEPHTKDRRLFLHYGDLTDSSNILRIIQELQPDEVYNLGAQSHVAVSFESAEYTADVDGLGPLRILEALRMSGLAGKTRFYQASTSELYGKAREIPQSETTPFYPRSPYAFAKQMAYWAVVNYREAYGIFACNGILFNHESPIRGETFVSRKITRGLTRIAFGLEECLYLGNLDAARDWGHARDYVEAQWLMLQQEHPEDYVIATGQQHTVRRFAELALAELGVVIDWRGKGKEEIAVVSRLLNGTPTSIKVGIKVGSTIIRVDPHYYRPTEVDSLLGDPTKAKEKLGWTAKTTFNELIAEMVQADYQLAKRDALMVKHGFNAFSSYE